MHRKVGRAAIVAQLSEGGAPSEQSTSLGTSNYAEGIPQRIDLQAALNLISEVYDLSKNPSDYIFAVARAVTAEVNSPLPNENGDAFTRDELLRFDHRLARRVYKTFDLKPNQINHRADNPKTARGFILDSTYNNTNPDDQYVECLLAIDATKDPSYAKGIKSGAIDSFSMGCIAEYTVCSICANKATSRWEFCSHIKSGKMKKFAGKLAYEICGGVCFEELSAVDQPADPKALMQEILSIRAQLNDQKNKQELGAESEILALNSRLAKLESSIQESKTMKNNKSAQMAPMSPKPQGDDDLIMAQEEPMMPEQPPMAPMAAPEEAPMLPFAGEDEMPMALDEEPPMAMQPAPAQMAPPAPSAPAPAPEMPMQAGPGMDPGMNPNDQDLANYKELQDQEEEAPMTGDEMGLMSQAARKLSLRYANKYSSIRVEATKAGNFRIFDERSGRGLYALKPLVRIASRRDAALMCETVLRYVAHHGLEKAMKLLKAIPYPKKAQVLEHAEDVMEEKLEGQSPAEGGGDDDKADSYDKPSNDSSKDMDSDKADNPESGPSSAIDSRLSNMSAAPEAGKLNSVDSPDSDKKDEADSPRGDSLKDEAHDHEERVAKVQAFFEKKIASIQADAKKREAELESRVEKLAEQKARSMMARFERCLNLASERQRLNHESSPLKIAMADALLTPFEINANEMWSGTETDLTAMLVERGMQDGMPAHLAALVDRAKEMYGYDDSFLVAAEKDIKKASVVPVEASRESNYSGPSSDLEERLVEGNPVLKTGASSLNVESEARMQIRANLGAPTFKRLYDENKGAL